MNPYHILSVDDEPDMEEMLLDYFRKAIREQRYHFQFARDGKAGLRLLRKQPDIDVLLLDINMPEMDGLTMLEQIAQETYIGQPFQFLKTIMVTAYGDMANIRQSMQHGAFDFLTKPLDLEDLTITIERAIQAAEREREWEQRRLTAEKKYTHANWLLDHGWGVS